MLRIILFIVVNGLLGSVQALAANHGVILQYHHVADNTPSATTLSPELFKRQMVFLRDNGFKVWPLRQLVEHLQADKPVPDGVVVITFDDAYTDIHGVAAPILKALEFPFTVFVSTEFVQNRQRGYMDWDQLRALQQQGATLGNHTHTHAHLLRQQPGERRDRWLARVKSEIQQAERLLVQETGEFPRYFAWPYGEADEALIALIGKLGYLGFGQQSGAVDKNLLLSGSIPRFPFNNFYADMTEFQQKASSLPLPLSALKAPATVWEKAAIPILSFELPENIQRLNCYASGQGAIIMERKGGRFEVKAKQPIPVGRSRYNCTAPVNLQDEALTLRIAPRFYWYSHQWIRMRDDGSWYPEP